MKLYKWLLTGNKGNLGMALGRSSMFKIDCIDLNSVVADRNNRVNLLDTNNLNQLISNTVGCIHLAGRTINSPKSENPSISMLRDNSLLAGLIARECAKYEKPLIATSSIVVYRLSADNREYYSEDFDLNINFKDVVEELINEFYNLLTKTPDFGCMRYINTEIEKIINRIELPFHYEYEISKYVGEKLMQIFSKPCILRLGHVYGPGISGNTFQTLVKRVHQGSISESHHKGIMSMLYVDEFAKLLNILVTNDFSKCLGEIFNVPGNRSIDLDYAPSILKFILGYKCNLKIIEREKKAKSIKMCGSKVYDKLKWQDRMPLSVGLKLILLEDNTTLEVENKDVVINIIEGRGYRKISELFSGGSAARTFVAYHTKSNTKVIVKTAKWTGITGNGYPWLQKQTEKLINLNKVLPTKYKKYFPQVFEAYNAEGYYLSILKYIEDSNNLSDQIINDLSIDKSIDVILNCINVLDKILYKHGYLKSNDLHLFNELHLTRLYYRVNLLADNTSETYYQLIANNPINGSKHFPNATDLSEIFTEVFKYDSFFINQRQVLSPFKIHSMLEEQQEKIEPHLSMPFKYCHGDLLLRNIMITNHPIFIDLRGAKIHPLTPDNINLGYELGKIIHSCEAELVRREALESKLEFINGKPHFFITDKNNSLCHKLRTIRCKLLNKFSAPSFTLAHTTCNSFLPLEIRLAEAIHFVTDSVNRLVNNPSGEKCLLYFILGTIKLNDVYNDICTFLNKCNGTYPVFGEQAIA